jgi:2OG-Fe(II) oxygenase superfamily
MQIIDNFLPSKYYLKLWNELNAGYFPWYYRDCNSDGLDYIPQLTHNVVIEGQISSKIIGDLKEIILLAESKIKNKVKGLVRAKFNMLLNQPYIQSELNKAIHQDTESDKYITVLYYFNDSDGDTVVYKNDKKTEIKRVAPKKNRCFIFNSNLYHNATPPKLNKNRIVLNLVFEINS